MKNKEKVKVYRKKRTAFIAETRKSIKVSKAVDAISKRSNATSKVENKYFYKHKNNLLLRKYGINVEQYNDMLIKQGSVCKICGQPETRKYKNIVIDLAVDHDHATGQVRGLLCSSCNIGVGNFKDNPSLLELAAKYIRQELD